METRDRTLTEWYVETSQAFWSGQWEGSGAAFWFIGIAMFLMFFIPINWHEISFWLWFFKEVYSQPIYGGCLAFIIIYRKVNRWKLSKKR